MTMLRKIPIIFSLLFLTAGIGFAADGDTVREGKEVTYGISIGSGAFLDDANVDDGSFPYMQAAGAGYGTSPLSTDGTDLVNSGALQTGETLIDGTTNDGSTYPLIVNDSDGTCVFSVDSNGAAALSGNMTVTKADPSIVFTPATATDTRYWLGVTEDADGVDDDKFQIGDGATPGTNPFVTVLTDGEVGVGTSAPTDKLDVVGKIRVQNTKANEENKTGFILGDQYATTAESEGVSMLLLSATATANSIRFGGSSSSHNAATDIKFYTASDTTTRSGTERMLIDTSGNVGIGTTAPTTTLAVAGGQTVKKTNVSDANYGTSALTTDYIVSFTSLTASRTATISTEDVQSGTTTQPRVMEFKDQSGYAGSFPITIVLENSGTIDGQVAYSINRSYGAVKIWLDGTNGSVAP